MALLLDGQFPWGVGGQCIWGVMAKSLHLIFAPFFQSWLCPPYQQLRLFVFTLSLNKKVFYRGFFFPHPVVTQGQIPCSLLHQKSSGLMSNSLLQAFTDSIVTAAALPISRGNVSTAGWVAGERV